MNVNTIPLFERLKNSQSILLAGAGGGFDIFSGLPLYFSLDALGKNVFLANLSFTNLCYTTGKQLTPNMVEVTADSDGSESYFPEKYLCKWFRQNKKEIPIFCFSIAGVEPIAESYGKLVDDLNIDTVVLIDGGTDSLMRGDEVGLGTPEEDIASIAAVHTLDIKNKLLVCLGFGIDTFHGICHAQFLEAVADLSKNKGFLGTFSLLNEMDEVKKYKQAIDFVHKAMPHRASIVSTSILSAIEGHYGDHHTLERTKGSKLWINPLMNIYWSFELEAIVQRSLYIERIMKTQTKYDISNIISKFRTEIYPPKIWDEIPS